MGKLDSLWTYHEAVMAYDQLQNEIKTTPSRVKFNKLRAFLSEQQNRITKLQGEMDAKSTLLKRLGDQFAELEQRYELELSEFNTMENDPECTSEEMTESRRAFEALLEQLNNARREIYDAVMWLEKAGVESKETLTKAAKAKKEYDATRVVCESELEQNKERVEEAQALVKKLAEDVPEDMLKRYNKVHQNHAIPIAKLENSQCGGCNMSLPMVVAKRVASHETLVECENCGRILW